MADSLMTYGLPGPKGDTGATGPRGIQGPAGPLKPIGFYLNDGGGGGTSEFASGQVLKNGIILSAELDEYSTINEKTYKNIWECSFWVINSDHKGRVTSLYAIRGNLPTGREHQQLTAQLPTLAESTSGSMSLVIRHFICVKSGGGYLYKAQFEPADQNTFINTIGDIKLKNTLHYGWSLTQLALPWKYYVI